MALTAGTRLGPYEILAPLGEGGMGEVYRARDTKLHRDVAVKVLPDLFAADPDRLARFKREAQVLAALNHPNIAAIHGLEDTNGVLALVLELVEGPTLADRLKDGALPLDEALPIGRQIAEALEAAHERGIVHRDLKPANVKVRADGTVKVLDFGLAKALEGDAAASDVSQSPTLSVAATRAGVILGTAAYMSPEQARGKAVDKRADIWAFGCVLFEMLTGRRAFGGDEITDTLAFIITKEPDWDALPPGTPPAIHRLLRRCLAKDRRHRLPDIGTARLEIDEAVDAPLRAAPAIAAATPRVRRRRVVEAVAAAAAVALAALAVWTLRPEPARPVRRLVIGLSADDRFSATGRHLLALSPDGSTLVYVANQRLYLRRMDRLEAVPIRGTEGGPADHARNPFFSPDGQWIGFWQGGELKKVAVTGGAPVALCKAELPSGASWGPDDVIIYGQGPSGIWQVPGSGGQPSLVTKIDQANGETTAHGPHMLPGGEAVLFTLRSGTGTSWNDAQIVIQRLDTGERRIIVEGGTDGRFLPTGHIVYAREGVLLAVPFDLARMTVTGGPVPVLEDVLDTMSFGGVGAGTGVGAAQFTTSRDGLLAYVPRGAATARTLVWVDRQGRDEVVAGAPSRAYVYPEISPDGTRVALDLRDQERDIWVWDFARTTLTRVTADRAADIGPRWTPDGTRIAFSSDRTGQLNLFWQAADGTGTAEQLATSTDFEAPLAFSPDGAQLFFHAQEPGGEYDMGILSLRGERRAQLVIDTDAFNEHNGALSPDGVWMAYQSNESGRYEIYLSPSSDLKRSRQLVSTDGGTRPAWARSGRELFYLTETGALMAVTIQTTPALTVGRPVKLFEGPYFRALNGRTYDVSPDGQRFLMIKDAETTTDTAPQIIIVENWLDELTRLVPVP